MNRCCPLGIVVWKRANQAIDSIRARFGENAVMRASFLKSGVEPTSGGLNKEKRREKERGEKERGQSNEKNH